MPAVKFSTSLGPAFTKAVASIQAAKTAATAGDVAGVDQKLTEALDLVAKARDLWRASAAADTTAAELDALVTPTP